MRTRLPALLLLPLMASACTLGRPEATSSPRPSGAARLACPAGDGLESDPQLGWSFCFPDTWQALGGEHLQQTDQPKGVDAVFDLTDYAKGPTNGLFGDMIISTDERGSAGSLAEWVSANVGAGVQLQPISWGNAIEAAQEVGGDHRRFALTPHHVVILDLRSGPGNLDLEGAMAPRLKTWVFTY